MAVLLNPRRNGWRRTTLYTLLFLLFLFICRTPTSNFWHPFEDKHPPTASKDVHPDRDQKPRQRLNDEMKEFLNWDPPKITDHYPPYGEYADRDYDPNRWEGFPQANGLFVASQAPKKAMIRFDPYPDYNTEEWKETWHGEYVFCQGLRGKNLNETLDDYVTGIPGIPENLPRADVGSLEAVGLDAGVCFDRYHRLEPYGMENPTARTKKPTIKALQLGQLQEECFKRNTDRYFSNVIPERRPSLLPPDFEDDHVGTKRDKIPVRLRPPIAPRPPKLQRYQPRTAVLIRTWDDFSYTQNDIENIRSLVTELSLASGGEYHVFLFVNVKDMTLDIWNNDDIYQSALEEFVPEELRDMAILWNEKVGQLMYPKVGQFEVYWQQFMPVQWFSKTHPEFDYVWNWEMDARLIGHHYHFLESMANFARKQPRKYLWERNSRFYIPLVHGTWQSFTEATNLYVQVAKKVMNFHTVWGPDKWHEKQSPLGPQPPHMEDEDDFEWGVGEEADLITLLPMFDPRETFWAYRDKLFNYPPGPGSYDERPFPHVPRRVFINTVVRFSRNLLHSMHMENQAGLGMASELWPASIALQHGWKAVYAPHPIWLSHQWPAKYADMIFNADGWGAGGLPGGTVDDGRGRAFDQNRWLSGQGQPGTGPNGEGLPARWSAERDSVYSPDREHNFAGWSWYFWSDFSRTIYSRWLGWKAGFSIVTAEGTQVTDELGLAGGAEWEEKNGRMCLPHMLLHPVKNVKPPEE